MKRFPSLTWTPAWTSILGCIHGCLKYLDIAPSMGWLFGGTGHGFLINMSIDGSCPSGPTAWNTSRLFELGLNLGYKVDGLFSDKRQPDWKGFQKEAWEMTKFSLDQGLPVVGWELAVPEWYIINGYDETGYYYNGPGADSGISPKPWDELGDTGIGMLEILSINPAVPAEDAIMIAEALEFSIAFNKGSKDWVLPEYVAGQEAYQAWIEAVSSGKALLMGHAYNTAVWEECRRNAVAFLREAKTRIPGIADEAFERAIQAYSDVANQLKEITELYPFFENNGEGQVGVNPKSEKATKLLQAAKKAEEQGTEHLEEILVGIK